MRKEREGEVFIFLEVFLWSFFPVLSTLALKGVPTLLALGWSTLFAALFFSISLLRKGAWKQLGDKKAVADILATTFILGILYYLFYFFGLRHTNPGNASLIALTEIFFSYLFFNVWRREKIPPVHLLGMVFMVAGAGIVLLPNLGRFQAGDFLIMGASFIAPFGNFFQRRAREVVDSSTIMFVRSLLSALFILLLAYLTGAKSPGSVPATSYFLFAANGLFLLGLAKVFWIEGIHRINVAKANAFGGVGPLLTLFYAWALLGDVPTGFQLFSFIPLFCGTLLLGRGESAKG